MICDNCSREGARVRHQTQICGPKGDKFLVHNVPVVSCPHCHETYMTAETAEELEQLIKQRKELAQPETVDAIQFAHA